LKKDVNYKGLFLPNAFGQYDVKMKYVR